MDKVSKERYVYQVFQNISKGYDQANQRISLGFQKRFKKMLLNRLKENTPFGGNVLDVCCGTGDITFRLADIRPDLQVTGLDFSPAMLSKARMRNKVRIHVTLQKSSACYVPDNSNGHQSK